MPSTPNTPVVLTIAGSDSGGGAGVQADLKTIAALGLHGACAITCVTAQNPWRVAAIHPVPAPVVAAQIDSVLEYFPPAAIKTGMLYDSRIIRAVADALARFRTGARARPPLIIDPVMISTSGAPLLKPRAVTALEKHLIPLATLITPNLSEAAFFLRRPLRTPADLRQAARDLHARWGCAVLVKGGHLRGVREAADFLCDARDELIFTAPFVRGPRTHGTGCVYSAAIASLLALGHDLPNSVREAKDFISQSIARPQKAGRGHVLSFPPTKPSPPSASTGFA